MTEPQVPQHGIVPFLVQEQLPAEPQAQIRLAVAVDIRRMTITAGPAREVEHAALADVDEQSNVLLASIAISLVKLCRWNEGESE